MKLSCNVIRDLLPLYAENLTSEESSALVDEHLCGCGECAKQLGILKKAQAIPVETDAPGLKKIRKAIVRRRVLAVTMAVMLVITLVLGAALLREAPVWLDADQAVKEVMKMEDGSIRIYYTDIVQGISSADDMAGNRGTLCWSTWGRVYFGEQIPPDPYITPDDAGGTTAYSCYGDPNLPEELREFDAARGNYWYISPKDGRAEVLLLKGEGDVEAPEEPLLTVSHNGAITCGVLAVMAVILAIPAYRFRKRRGAPWLTYGAALAGCGCVSLLVVSGGQFAEFYGDYTAHVRSGSILLIPMFLTAVCAIRLQKLKAQDKGI
ncbi:MAG TPA: hypothetical protein DDY81_07430 [Clostridiales bacterium]|nr:hypothetical protein [Clostridiales bacterium]